MIIDKRFWNVLGWISLVLFFITAVYYLFVDANLFESPIWLIATVACWFYRDYLDKEEKNKQNSTKE
ncbi:MAG: hypothetical protein FJX80_13685 [Bacteroidetes bacterium]|nr:hypothetical protein [Bacteroidota bacterium]